MSKRWRYWGRMSLFRMDEIREGVVDLLRDNLVFRMVLWKEFKKTISNDSLTKYNRTVCLCTCTCMLFLTFNSLHPLLLVQCVFLSFRTWQCYFLEAVIALQRSPYEQIICVDYWALKVRFFLSKWKQRITVHMNQNEYMFLALVQPSAELCLVYSPGFVL